MRLEKRVWPTAISPHLKTTVGARVWPFANRLRSNAGRNHLQLRQCLRCEERHEFVRQHRPAHQKALNRVTMMRAQQCLLLGGLDALGHHREVERATEGNDRLGDRFVVVIARDSWMKDRSILRTSIGSCLTRRHRRIAGAEIVDGDLAPPGP